MSVLCFLESGLKGYFVQCKAKMIAVNSLRSRATPSYRYRSWERRALLECIGRSGDRLHTVLGISLKHMGVSWDTCFSGEGSGTRRRREVFAGFRRFSRKGKKYIKLMGILNGEKKRKFYIEYMKTQRGLRVRKTNKSIWVKVH